MVDDVGENQRGAVEPGDAAQRRHVWLDPEIAVAVLPVRHLIAGERLHIHVEGEEVVAALHAVSRHLIEEILDLDPLAEQPPLHVGECSDDRVDRPVLAGLAQVVEREHAASAARPTGSGGSFLALLPRRHTRTLYRRHVTSKEAIEVIEPATEQVMAELPRAGAEETDAAIERAKAAFPSWAAVAPGERSVLLHRLANAIEAHSEHLATLEARNAGKPIS